jgi:hypothetical protein
VSALDRAVIEDGDPRKSQARLALERLLADHEWHPWWQVEQVGGVYVDPRIAGRRFIRNHEDHRLRRGTGRPGLEAYQRDPEAAERAGRRRVIREFLLAMGAERRGERGESEWRLPPPPETDPGKGGRR